MNLLFTVPTYVFIILGVIALLLVVAIIALVVHSRKSAATQPLTDDDYVEEDVTAEEEQEKEAKEEAEEEQEKAEKSKVIPKAYHITKRKEDGRWQVKLSRGARAIKLFATQAEAIEYAKRLADNQEGRIVIHKEDGSFRNLTYKKK